MIRRSIVRQAATRGFVQKLRRKDMIMKKMISLALVFALVMVMAIPGSAAVIEEEQVMPRTNTYRTMYDDNGTGYSVYGSTTISGISVVIVTGFSVFAYPGGKSENAIGTQLEYSAEGYVYFDDALPNFDALSAMGSHTIQYKSNGTVASSNSCGDTEYFDDLPVNAGCTHYFESLKGGSISFSSGDS